MQYDKLLLAMLICFPAIAELCFFCLDDIEEDFEDVLL